jgi:hypothetical protein
MRASIPVLAMLAAAAAAGVSFTPLISYSSASGFIFGGLLGVTAEGAPGGGLTAMATMTTGGGQVVEIKALSPLEGSGWRLALLHERLVNRRFRGWGNGGDPDSNLTYDREQHRAAVSREQYFSQAVSAELGAEVLHSTVYNREAGGQWSEAPSQEYGSKWTAGPFARLRFQSYLPSSPRSHTDLTASLQYGERLAYGSSGASTVAYLPLPWSNIAALRTWLSYSWGLEETPFAMLPSLGPDQILRGYDSRRFYGPWRLVANVEIRRPLLSIFFDRETSMPRSVLGMVVFADFGQVAEQFQGFRWDRVHPDAGVGLRFTQMGATMAADFALLSPEGFKIALGFGESY